MIDPGRGREARGSCRRTAVAAVILGLVIPLAGPAAASPSAEESGGSGASRRPELSWPADGGAVLIGATAFGLSRTISTDTRPVPVEGFDRAAIAFGFDRNSVRPYNHSAARWSNVTLVTALAVPLAAMFLAETEDATGLGRRTVILLGAETFTAGTVALAKSLASRPRPYLHVPAPDRPEPARGTRVHDDAFRSFPSGHAALSACAAGLAVSDHLLGRPRASFGEHAAVGFAAGATAASTARLRVRAGVHFPTDVLAGAAFGAATGVTVPLLHEYEGAGRIDEDAWMGAVSGALSGVIFGVWVIPALHGLF